MRNLGNDSCRRIAQARLAVRVSNRGAHLDCSRPATRNRRWFFAVVALVSFPAVFGSITNSPSSYPSIYVDSAAAAEMPPQPLTVVDVKSVNKGYGSGVREPQQSLIRTQAEWLELWRKHTNDFNATPPTIFFDQEVVAAVFLGEKPTGGYDITIVRAERSDEELIIYYREKAPAPGSILVQVFTQPFHMVRINRQDLATKVTFRRES